MKLKFFDSRDDRPVKLGIKCLVTVLLFIGALGALVYPVHMRVQSLDSRIADMNMKLAEQDVFVPQYAHFSSLLAKTPKLSLPLPPKTPLDRQDAFGVVAELERVAAGAGMDPLDVSVDQNAVRSGADAVKVTGVFSGHEADFKRFFIAVSSLPYIGKVARVEIRSVPGALEVLMELSVLVKT